jgi:hypothetical protein
MLPTRRGALHVPDAKAFDVKLNTLVGNRANSLHEELPGTDNFPAGVALLAIAGATPDAGDAVVRELTAGELVSNDEVETVSVHVAHPAA